MPLDTYRKFDVIDIYSDNNEVIPTPGSEKAQRLGCVCPVMDNYQGKGMPYKDSTRFWISGECHIHRFWEGVKGYKKVDPYHADGSVKRSKRIVRIYTCDNDGRPDPKPYEIDEVLGANYVRNMIALSGETSIPEARAWGHRVKAVGHEEGIMTVHLGARWI